MLLPCSLTGSDRSCRVWTAFLHAPPFGQTCCTHCITVCPITKQHEVLGLLTFCGLHATCSGLAGCCSLLPVTHVSGAPASRLPRCLPISTTHLLLAQAESRHPLEHVLLACRVPAITQSCTSNPASCSVLLSLSPCCPGAVPSPASCPPRHQPQPSTLCQSAHCCTAMTKHPFTSGSTSLLNIDCSPSHPVAQMLSHCGCAPGAGLPRHWQGAGSPLVRALCGAPWCRRALWHQPAAPSRSSHAQA